MKLLSIVLLMTVLFKFESRAGDNLPNLVGAKKIGRVMLFTTPKKVNWYLPIALTVDLACSPDTSQNRSCALKINNNLNELETNGLNEYQRNSGSTVTYFSAFNSNIVRKVDEAFEGFPVVLNSIPTVNRSLELNSLAPYARIDFRDKAEVIRDIETRYISGGLGFFRAEISLQAESLGDYLRPSKFGLIRASLQAVPTDGFNRQELHHFLDDLVASSDFKVNNFNLDEARALFKSYLRYQFFKLINNEKYVLNHDRLNEFKDDDSLIDETYSPISFICSVQIELKKDSEQQLHCM